MGIWRLLAVQYVKSQTLRHTQGQPNLSLPHTQTCRDTMHLVSRLCSDTLQVSPSGIQQKQQCEGVCVCMNVFQTFAAMSINCEMMWIRTEQAWIQSALVSSQKGL